MEGQPLYKIGDVLKPNKEYAGYQLLPQAILLTELVWVENHNDLYWAYEYVEITTGDTDRTSCYRIDQLYKKVA